MGRWASAFFLLACAVLCAAPAHADEPATDRAERLFREGSDSAAKGDYATACPKLAESQRLDPALGTEWNLALCYEKLGRLGSAWRHFSAVERLAHAAGKTTREQDAHKKLEAIRSRVPHLVFVGREADTTVKVDGERVEDSDLAFYAVDAGEHAIEATAPAKQGWKTKVTIAEGDPKPERIVTIPALGAVAVNVTSSPPPVAVAPPPPPPPPSDSRRTIAIAAGGVGVVGVVAAAVTGIMLLDAKSTADDQCLPRCDNEGRSAVDRGETLLPINAIAWGVAIVGLGVGAYFLLTSHGASTSTALTTSR